MTGNVKRKTQKAKLKLKIKNFLFIHLRPRTAPFMAQMGFWPQSIQLLGSWEPRALVRMGSIFFVFSFALCALSLHCFAQPLVSSTDLIEQAKKLDGKDIVYQGEVIGEVMMRGDYAWVNINDGLNAIGVWMPRDLAKTIEFAGSFKAKGDWVEVKGKFNRACIMHGSDLDMHCLSLLKIKSGRLVEDRLVAGKKGLVITLSGVALCLLILQLFSKKR